jgi:hypothetical protein
MKKKKLKPLNKVLKETQVLFNKSIRERDGKCLRCGKTEHLQAHHHCIRQGSSSLHRFDPRNCMTLCVGCHLYWYHKDGDLMKSLELKHIAIKNGICTEQDIEEMISNRHEIKRWSRVDLEELKESLTFDKD